PQALAALDPAQARAWLPPGVYARLAGGREAFLADLRPVAVVFFRFGGFAYDADPAAGQKLDTYIRWVQRLFARYDGTLLNLTLGDKGAYGYGVCGAPAAHEDDPLRALAVAHAIRTPPAAFADLPPVQIGVSAG